MTEVAKARASGINLFEDEHNEKRIRSRPLYMQATDDPAPHLQPDWHKPFARTINKKTGNTVIPIPGYAEAMRSTLELAIGTENICRLVAGKGEPFLKQYPQAPEKGYALRLDLLTRDLFERLDKETLDYTKDNATERSIGGITSVADMARMLFGDFIWKVSHASTQPQGTHTIPIRVTRRVCDLSPFMAPFGPLHVFKEEEMRFVAYACAVLAYESGFYIYNYNERRIDRSQTMPEDIVVEISWVY